MSTTSVEETGLHQVELQSLFLIDCSVNRGESLVDPDGGRVEASIDVSTKQSDTDLLYEIAAKYEFSNKAEEFVAQIEVTFGAYYQKPPDVTLTQSEVDDFTHSVLFQLVPFQREFLASITNRMAMPPFYLPLVRSGDIEIRREGSELESKESDRG